MSNTLTFVAHVELQNSILVGTQFSDHLTFSSVLSFPAVTAQDESLRKIKLNIYSKKKFLELCN